MKNHFSILALAIIYLGLLPAYSQFGPPRAPGLSGSMAKLFGDNPNFSATLEIQNKGGSPDQIMTMPAKIFFSDGESRLEMDMTQMKSAQMRPEATAQIKSMGMDKMVMIARPDRKKSYMIYPGMQSYAEIPLQDIEASATTNNFKMETAELGKETVDGHPCVKNQVTIIYNNGDKHVVIVWNATDLKKSPVKMEQTEQGNTATMLYKDINLSKPDASLFEPPSNFTKYDSMQTMMQTVMMKRMGGGMGFPPPNR